MRNNLVERWRKFRGHTQQELAALVHISPGTLCQIETGQSQPRLNIILALAYHLQTLPTDLFPELATIPTSLCRAKQTPKPTNGACPAHRRKGVAS